MMNLIRRIALGINLAIWAVLGLVFWIPVLARTTAALAGAILYCTITQTDPQHLRSNFEAAANLYSRGFQAIYRVLGSNVPATSAYKPTAEQLASNFRRLLLEVLWTVVFWVTVVFSVATLTGNF